MQVHEIVAYLVSRLIHVVAFCKSDLVNEIDSLCRSGKDDMVDPDVEAIEDNGRRGRDDDEDGADGRGTMNRRGGGKSGQGQEAVDDDNESVNSDDEAGDPDAAKAQLAADGGQYMGDKEDSRLLEEWDHEPEEGDEMADEDKGKSFQCPIKPLNHIHFVSFSW